MRAKEAVSDCQMAPSADRRDSCVQMEQQNGSRPQNGASLKMEDDSSNMQRMGVVPPLMPPSEAPFIHLSHSTLLSPLSSLLQAFTSTQGICDSKCD